MSLWAFQEKLGALGHFYTRYQNIDQLKFHFNQQLDKLAASGFIEPKSDQGRAAGSTDSTRPAKQQTEQQVKAYLRWLRSRTESIELCGIERVGGAPVVLLPLETAYVPLRAKSMPRLGEAQEVMHFKQRPNRSRRTSSDSGQPYDPDDTNRENLEAGDDVLRVVRGGTWLDVRVYARCAYRYWSRPVSRDRRLGFRVVLRSAPVR